MSNMEERAFPQPERPETAYGAGSDDSGKRRTIIIAVIVGVILLAAVVVAVVFLMRSSTYTTGRIRDIFIIFMALESLIIGVALVILMVQLATLINLLQNEIKPIINSTNETVSTLRGTVTFLSDNMVEPVIKLNGYLSGLKTFFDLVSPKRRK
jgi:NADH:ubiquinone oxidoreductase subunit K